MVGDVASISFQREKNDHEKCPLLVFDHFLESHQYLESFKVWTRHTAREKCDTRIMGVKIPSETLAITNGHFMCNVVVHSKGKEREPSPYQFVQFSIKRIENAPTVKHKILEGL